MASSPQFQWVAVVFGMILGLGITRILSGMAATFRSRVATRPDWIALAWAAAIFIAQLELWWGLSDLRDIVKEWTFPLFLLFAGSPLVLFVAAAMVLPNTELAESQSQRELFERHGHWALFAISAYFALTIIENAYFWRAPLLQFWAILGAALMLLPIAAFFAPRRTRGAFAAVNLLLTVCFVVVDVAIPDPAAAQPGATPTAKVCAT